MIYHEYMNIIYLKDEIIKRQTNRHSNNDEMRDR